MIIAVIQTSWVQSMLSKNKRCKNVLGPSFEHKRVTLVFPNTNMFSRVPTTSIRSWWEGNVIFCSNRHLSDRWSSPNLDGIWVTEGRLCTSLREMQLRHVRWCNAITFFPLFLKKMKEGSRITVHGFAVSPHVFLSSYSAGGDVARGRFVRQNDLRCLLWLCFDGLDASSEVCYGVWNMHNQRKYGCTR